MYKNQGRMKLHTKVDCANAPKKELIKNLTIQFATYDLDATMAFMDDNVVWTLVGDSPVVGKKQFKTELQKMSGNKATELTILSIITHGKEAAVHGEMTMMDGNRYGFADFYEFTSAKGTKVKSITTYIIHKKNDPITA